MVVISVFSLFRLSRLARYFPDSSLCSKCKNFSRCFWNSTFLRIISSNLIFILYSSFNVCSLGVWEYILFNILNLFSNSSSSCWFVLCFYVEYDIIFPLKTTLAVSQSVDADMSVVSFFFSRKDVYSFIKYSLNSLSCSRDVFILHLWELLAWFLLLRVIEIGAWSEIIMRLIFVD